MFDFTKAKTNAMEGIGKHSTLISFIVTAVGVGATIWFASKEIPKAKAEVKEILAKDDITSSQKATAVTKSVAKNCWKTAVIALGTVLLVTGTAAITTANAATSVATLTSALNLTEQKLKDTNEAINEHPNKKVKEEIQNSVAQKTINRATANLKEEDFVTNDVCPDMYVWTSRFDGVTFKATFQMIEALEDIVDARITNRGYITIEGVYDILVLLGAQMMTKEYPQVDEIYGWNGGFELCRDVVMNDEGYTIHYIDFSEPTRDF